MTSDEEKFVLAEEFYDHMTQRPSGGLTHFLLTQTAEEVTIIT